MPQYIKPENTPLSPPEAKYIATYLVNFDKKAAAKAAGVKYATGNKYLYRPHVKRYLKEHAKAIQEKCELTVEDVVNELKKIAFFKHSEYAEDFQMDVERGNIGVTMKEFENIDTSAIASMNAKINAQGIPYVEIKPYNKVEALKIILDHIKGYQGPTDVHFHLEDNKDMSAQEVAAKYQVMIQESP